MSIFNKAQLLYEKSVNGKIDESDMDMIIAWPHHEISVLFACADQVRRRFFDDRVDPCSLMNIKSGNCSEDCAFCSQSAHNSSSVQIRELAKPKRSRNRRINLSSIIFLFAWFPVGANLPPKRSVTFAIHLRNVRERSTHPWAFLMRMSFGC